MLSSPETHDQVADVSVEQMITDALAAADQALRGMREEDMKGLLVGAVRTLQGAIDTAVSALPDDDGIGTHSGHGGNGRYGNQRERLVFDTENFDENFPERPLTGTPINHEMMYGVEGDLGGMDLDMQQGAAILKMALLDVRETLLGLSESDIEELAQASLIVARIALNCGKRVHQQICSGQAQLALEANTHMPNTSKHDSASLEGLSRRDTDNGSSNKSRGAATPTRGRTLWDPLAPKMMGAMQHLAEQGKSKPATGAAVAAVALPFSWMLAVAAPPILMSDAFLQWGVTTPIGQQIDGAAGEALEVAHLWWLISKVSIKQSVRFAAKEFERGGGMEGLLKTTKNVAGTVAADPVGCAKTGWGYLQMGAGVVYEQAMRLRGG